MSKNRVIVEAVLAGQSHGSVARQYGISTVWVGKLVARWRAGGWDALAKQSTRPKSNPNATSQEVVARVIALRQELTAAGLDAGPHTLHTHLHGSGLPAPSVTTIWRILTREGLVTPEPRKRPKRSYLRFEADLPNECWQSDFTHWPLADGTDTEILTWLDDHARYALSLTAHTPVTGQDVVTTFRAAVDAHGIPASTLTDNGLVFTTRFLHGPNDFERELVILGIEQKNGRPNHPQTQGKVERFQQTLKKWLRAQPPAATLADLQTQLEAFREVYNHQPPASLTRRPHPRTGLHRARQGHPHRPRRALADPPRQGRQDRTRHPAPRRTPAPHRPGLRTQRHHRADPRPRPAHHRHQRRHRRDHPRPDPRPHPRLPTPRPTTRTTQRQPPTRRTQEEDPTDINEVARHLLTMSRDFTLEPPRVSCFRT